MALRAIKNQQIIEAAQVEFVTHGFLGAKMDAIAERARVSKRTVYKHFASKEALFVEMIAITRAEFRGVVPDAFDPIPDESSIIFTGLTCIKDGEP